MVLLISSKTDYSTVEVMRWLRHYQQKVIRINGVDQIELLEIDQDIKIQFKGEIISFDEIQSVWFRRGDLSLSIFDDADPNSDNSDCPANVRRVFLKSERDNLQQFLHYKLMGKPGIGSRLTTNLNKLVVLDKARKVGLKVPNTLITSRLEKLKNFNQQANNGLITKSIGLLSYVLYDNQDWSLFTTKVDEDSLAKQRDSFFPSKFQECIDKKYEIRTFVIGNQCYSMAIFSQSNERTKVDFRKYDTVKPNRTVPFQLPVYIEEKLIKLSSNLNLNSCSIDLLVDKEGNFIFLEVNPVGQFGMVSFPCNYFLEQKVAKYLINQN